MEFSLGGLSVNHIKNALSITPEGFSLVSCVLEQPRTIKIAELVTCLDPFHNPSYLKDELITIINRHHLRYTPVNVVLHHAYYKTTSVDVPQLPQEEHCDAVRWQLGEIIDYPAEDTAIDVFYPRVNAAKMYAVVTQKSLLQAVADAVQSAGLSIRIITTRQLALTNLIMEIAQPQSGQSTGVLEFSDDKCVLFAIQDGTLYFVRHFVCDRNKILEQNNALFIDEIKKCFSYCKQELNYALPKQIYFLAHSLNQQDLFEASQRALKEVVDLKLLDLSQHFTFECSVGEMAPYYAALGALLDV